MKTNDLYYLDAHDLARLIRTKEVSPVEVVKAHLDRVAQVNPRINAVVTVMGDEAMAAAKLAEAAIARGEKQGPLHGVPFSIKDSLATAGVANKRGSRLYADHIPAEDATTVARFRSAGGIPLIKTNLPEFSAWWESDNFVTGCTLNPWNLERTAGGSSGGESAAIAAGMSPIGLGSDVGISVRGPAHFTGIAALKATHGRIPYTGHFPERLSRYWHVGPMARSVRDLRTALSVLSGPDGRDGYAVLPAAMKPPRRPDGTQLRVGWAAGSSFGPIHRDVEAAVVAAAQALTDAGCHVEPVRLPMIEDGHVLETFGTVVAGELRPYLRRLVAGREGDLHPVVTAFMSQPDPSLTEFTDAQESVEKLRAGFAGYFDRYDVLLAPVIAIPAPIPGQMEHVIEGVRVPAEHVMSATSPFNLTGLPALSVPFRFSADRLPIGVQLVSRWHDEDTILDLGLQLEKASHVSGVRPPI